MASPTLSSGSHEMSEQDMRCACGCGRPRHRWLFTDPRDGSVAGQLSRFAKRHSQTQEERFWKHVSPEPNSGCWLWTGAINSDGYGSFMVFSPEGRKYIGKAYKFAYESFHGKVPKGLELDHKCRVRNCVNPDHLEPVTHLVNIHRGSLVKTHCKYGHEFTPENALIIKVKTKSGIGRRCKSCARGRR